MTDVYRPDFVDTERVSELKESGTLTYVDAHIRQLRELYLVDTPPRAADKETAFRRPEFAAFGAAHANDFVHVHYPWNHTVVKTVGEKDYVRLKTNRNRDLITVEEQQRLRGYRVAVFGLSVGSNIAFALTQGGFSENIILADPDVLDTTNLNRVFAGVHEVGINKAVIAARHIYEDNPFAQVEVLDSGIDADALEKLLKEKRIDCIVEEVDDMSFKIEARKLAMEYKVPVVMVTDNGDGVVLHVERYDLDWQKIFGREARYFASLAQPMDREATGKLIMEEIVGGAERVDPTMLASVKRVLAHELVSWSQLGTAALLAGVVATYAIKQIALGKSKEPDIRAHISPTSAAWQTHET